MIAYPALHFCVLIERVRATMLAEKYEREGQRLGVIMVLVIVSYIKFLIINFNNQLNK